MDAVQLGKSKRSEPRRKIYEDTACILTRNQEGGNIFAVGIFNIVTVHTFLVPLALILNDSYKAGRLFLDLERFFVLLGAPWEWLVVAIILVLEFVLAFIVYFCFLGWAVCYRRCGKAANTLFLLLLLVYIIITRRAIFYVVFDMELHPAGRIICCIQQLVFCLKWVSFIHENAYKVFYPWHKDDETGPAVWYAGQMEPQIGSFSSYVYFLFCPVLLYRDKYPRKPPNPLKAFSYFIQFIMSISVGYVIFKDFLFPRSMYLDDLVTSLLRCIFLAFIQLSIAYLCLAHGWFNMWAEILGFADHGFYQDWWNSRSLAEYLVKWDSVVQDWFKTYIYGHLKKQLPRFVALLATLLLSALEHDILISSGLGFFLPMYLVEYGLGGLIMSLKPSLGEWTDQITMSLGLCVGSGLQMWFYCTEIAARIYCPKENSSFFDGLQMIDCYRHFN